MGWSDAERACHPGRHSHSWEETHSGINTTHTCIKRENNPNWTLVWTITYISGSKKLHHILLLYYIYYISILYILYIILSCYTGRFFVWNKTDHHHQIIKRVILYVHYFPFLSRSFWETNICTVWSKMMRRSWWPEQPQKLNSCCGRGLLPWRYDSPHLEEPTDI